jgi:hypothetical protein
LLLRTVLINHLSPDCFFPPLSMLVFLT